MTKCCSPETRPGRRGKYLCPTCGEFSGRVSTTTILHQLKAPWRWQEAAGKYYFCEAPTCGVVYFADNGWIARSSDVRTPIGLKNPSDRTALICYCFGISNVEAEENPALKAYVIEKTKAHTCACETCNPSGRCCLKDFPV